MTEQNLKDIIWHATAVGVKEIMLTIEPDVYLNLMKELQHCRFITIDEMRGYREDDNYPTYSYCGMVVKLKPNV